MWQKELFEEIPQVWDCNHLDENGVKALFYSGVPYKGKETRVFAWIGLPEGACSENKVPAVVLVHGGGGTAFSNWVRIWNKRGYAAIAMDNCGAMPPPNNTAGCGEWPRHNFSGPNGWGCWGQENDAPEDQWMYHAVNAVARAHSLIASYDEVDSDRIGVTGISWGGVLTCISASLDNRYKCAVPVYGCGYLTEDSSWLPMLEEIGSEKADFWDRNWNPSAYLSKAECPMLWFNGTNDFTFFPLQWQKSALLPKGESTLCMKLRWPHGHGPISEEVPEIFTYMDSHLMGGKPLPKLTDTSLTANIISCKVKSPEEVLGVQLVVTFDSCNWERREWHTLAANLSDGIVSAKIPRNATAAYLQLIDNRKLYVTSEIKFFNISGQPSEKNS